MNTTENSNSCTFEITTSTLPYLPTSFPTNPSMQSMHALRSYPSYLRHPNLGAGGYGQRSSGAVALLRVLKVGQAAGAYGQGVWVLAAPTLTCLTNPSGSGCSRQQGALPTLTYLTPLPHLSTLTLPYPPPYHSLLATVGGRGSGRVGVEGVWCGRVGKGRVWSVAGSDV